MAGQGNHEVILEKLWVWAEETQQNSNEVKNQLLLTKDLKGSMACEQATEFGSLEALDTLRRLTKEAELNPDELLLA